jgi:hypothetical protein
VVHEPRQDRQKARDIAKPFRVTGKDKFRLKDFDPGDTGDLGSEDKPRAKEMLQAGVEALAELQDKLYAQDRWSLLLVFQAMDAAGKDGAIKHVMSGVNPQGCQVVSFKSPSSEELDHDYLWRCNRNLPERGRIGIFNRSYYEEVLVLRVHRALLENQKLPPQRITKDIWTSAIATSAPTSAISMRTARSCANSFCTCRAQSRRSGFWSASTSPRRTGSCLRPTRASAVSGTTTWTRTRTPLAQRQRRIARGMSCLPTTSGSRASWSRPPSSRRWTRST